MSNISLQQAQLEGYCLRYPENLGLHQNVTYDNAVAMLLRAIPLSSQFPFQWVHIDKPPEGQVYLLFLQPPAPFPNDGIRWQEPETRYQVAQRDLEVCEVKFGFVPNSQDTSAWRVRRRFRLMKGGHPHLVLVHYTRGPQMSVVPSLLSQPVRSYPLRPLNEPAIFVMGDKKGQLVYPQGSQPPQPMGGMVPNLNLTPQAMIAQQNSNLEALERRTQRERGRDRSVSMGTGRPPPPRAEEEDSADELEQISTRTLASTRYKRNHRLMDEVFRCAAFPERVTPVSKSAYSIFDKADLEAKISKLSEEVQELQHAAETRKARAKAAAEAEQQGLGGVVTEGDVNMEVVGDGDLR